MAKSKVYFHSKTETIEQIIERTAAKLEAAQRLKIFGDALSVNERTKEKIDKYTHEQENIMKDRVAQINKLCYRAGTVRTFNESLDILSEEVMLVDLDKVFEKGDDGKWRLA